MSGVLWAAVAGVGFGLFQTANRAAIEDMDVYRSTFIQLLVSAVILVVASLATEDITRLANAPAVSIIDFSLAGLVHFFVGWTLLNASQKRLGAARTSPLLATTPLFGALIAAVTLGEVPSAMALVGTGLIVVGVYAIGLDRVREPRTAQGWRTVPAGRPTGAGAAPVSDPGPDGFTWSAALPGLGTALCWAISPTFIRRGLEGLPSPLLGVTISLVASVAAYGLALLARPPARSATMSRRAWTWKLTAGVLVGLSTWTRWYALALAPVAVVLGLGLLSVPTVIALAPVLMGRHVERLSAPILAGAGLVVAGALVLIVKP